jgi:predicted RNA-binding Zn-ribbon protein involved in translation (DUF1610 family)
MRVIIAAFALLSVASCSSQPKSAQTAAPAAKPAADAVVASAPREIQELTNQKLVYECPKCGMDFDAPGTCTMDGSTLAATQVDYSCPADGQAVERAGQCPRCAMNARVRKTTMASAVTSDHR